jgi:hypothetical protein
MVTLARLERAALCLEGRCSIQLSYRAMEQNSFIILSQCRDQIKAKGFAFGERKGLNTLTSLERVLLE